MNKTGFIKFVFSMILIAGFSCSLTAQAYPLLFTEQSMQQIETAYQGKPFVLVLWSQTCAPCMAELKMLGEELAQNPELPLVLVSSDPPALQDEIQMRLEDYGLDAANSWQFAHDFQESLRYTIDPLWFGEMPRSYFYDAAGQRSAQSGTISSEHLRQWLAEQ